MNRGYRDMHRFEIVDPKAILEATFLGSGPQVTGSEPKPGGQLKSLTRSVRWELVEDRLTRAAFKRKGDDAEVIFSDCFY